MTRDTETARPTGFPFLDLMLAAQRALFDASLGAAAPVRTGAFAAARGGAARTEEVIPLAEEVLHVETRRVAGGTTRVRRYVVESPVERRVALRDERIVVERRRPAAVDAATGDVLVEKTVQATETSEVPVAWKGVRVREEVVLRLEARERTEVVRGTVRRDEIEIDEPRSLVPVGAVAGRERTGRGEAAPGSEAAPGTEQHNDNAKAVSARRDQKSG
jgi:stress response protein YsnF